MANVIAMPLRLASSGIVAAVEQGTDDYYKQQIVALLLTMQGERPINIDFGMPDMAFQGFLYSTFHNQVVEYLPEVSDLYIEIEDDNDMEQTVVIGFNTLPERS